MYSREKVTEEESLQIGQMLNYFSNQEVMPVLARAHVAIIPMPTKEGTMRLQYEVHVMQDIHMAYNEVPSHNRYLEHTGTGDSLKDAMMDLSSKLRTIN